jgi:hypothetical protein
MGVPKKGTPWKLVPLTPFGVRPLERSPGFGYFIELDRIYQWFWDGDILGNMWRTPLRRHIQRMMIIIIMNSTTYTRSPLSKCQMNDNEVKAVE